LHPVTDLSHVDDEILTGLSQMADKTEVKDFTQRELEIMGKAWSCMTSEPQVRQS